MTNYQPWGIDTPSFYENTPGKPPVLTQQHDDYLGPMYQFAQTPLQLHNAAVRAVLADRAPAYGNEHEVASLAGALFSAAQSTAMPSTNAQLTYVFQLCFKTARAIVGGLHGNYNGDHALDDGAYEALLAAHSSKRSIAEVLG
jgi:hypothetical protein